MLERFKSFWTGLFAPIGNFLLKIGVTPDQVTLVGTLGVSAGALWFFPRGEFLIGTLVVTAFVFSDLVDGYMARTSGHSSSWGAFLDSTMDRFGDAAVFGGIALWWAWGGDSPLWLVISLYCLVLGNVTSYARARAESLGYDAKGGIAERSDRLVLILVATGFAGLLDLMILQQAALSVLAVASTVTVFQRLLKVRRQAIA